MGKTIKNAKNGPKMILAKFHHVELRPPQIHTYMYRHKYRLMVITLSVW